MIKNIKTSSCYMTFMGIFYYQNEHRTIQLLFLPFCSSFKTLATSRWRKWKYFKQWHYCTWYINNTYFSSISCFGTYLLLEFPKERVVSKKDHSQAYAKKRKRENNWVRKLWVKIIIIMMNPCHHHHLNIT